MSKFCILLSAYNGEKYIREQIESLLNQKGVEVEILVRNDGSKDKTSEIIKSFNSDKIFLIEGENVGFKNSFYKLVENARPADYYAYCDQDDVWYDTKLKNAEEMFATMDNSKPCMDYCALKVMNIEKNIVYAENSHKNFKFNKEFAFCHCFLGNFVYGCACMFNNKAREMFLMTSSDNINYHDWFMNMLCTGCGEVEFDKRVGLIYRQHGNNTIGFFKAGFKNFKKNLKLLFGEQFKNIRSNCMKTIYDQYHPYMSEENLKFANLVLNYKKSFKNKLNLLNYRGVKKAPKDVRFLGKLLILFGKF